MQGISVILSREIPAERLDRILKEHQGPRDTFSRGSVEKAHHELILYLNPEIQTHTGWLGPLLRYMEHDDCFSVSPLIRRPDGTAETDLPYSIDLLPRPLVTLKNPWEIVLMRREKFEQVRNAKDPFAAAREKGWTSFVAPESAVFKESGVVTPLRDGHGGDSPATFEAWIGQPKRRMQEVGPEFEREIETGLAERLHRAFNEVRIVDLGCGRRKFPGALGMDFHPGEDVDLVHDLDALPWPIDDASCDLVIASHVMEHVRDFGGVLSECHRILKPEGALVARCPHFSCRESFINPTHVRHLAYESMAEMLLDVRPGKRHDLSCSLVPFHLVKTVLTFRGRKRASLGCFLARRKPRRWEQYWSRILPAQEVCWILRKPTPFDEPDQRITG